MRYPLPRPRLGWAAFVVFAVACAEPDGGRSTGLDGTDVTSTQGGTQDAPATGATGQPAGPFGLGNLCLGDEVRIPWSGLPPVSYRDVTGDGRADAMSLGFMGDEWTATVYLGDAGPDRWQAAVQTIVPRAQLQIIDDIDGDGRADLLTPMQFLRVERGTPSGELEAMDATFSVVPYVELTTADFDSDGRVDLIGATFEGSLQSLRGTGSGDFELAASLDVTTPQNAVTLYPDASGRSSVGVMTGVAAGCISCTQSGFSLLRLDPDGAMRITAELTWGSAWSLILPTIGELYGGGPPEAIVDLGLDQRTVFSVEDGELVPTGALPNGPEAFGDLNGDGHDELVVHDGSAIRVFTDGGTALAEVLAVSSPSAPELHASDADGNGTDDVVLFYPAGVNPAAGETAPTVAVRLALPCP